MHSGSVLFIVRSYSGTGAQPIRFRELISRLSGTFNIHVLELTHGNPGVRVDEGVTIHSVRYSLLGRVLNPPVVPGGSSRTGSGSFSRPIAVIKRHLRSLFFPDTVVTEVSRLRREAVRLTCLYGCTTVVLSAFPFSVLPCARVLKRKTGAGIILDVGDPFCGNSRNGVIKDLLARKFEQIHLRYVDRLVVTNEMTRNHYLAAFNHPGPGRIHIIPMGISQALASSFNPEKRPVSQGTGMNPFVLVYAGQLYRKLREPYELYRAVNAFKREDGSEVELRMYGSFSREFSAGFAADGTIVFGGHVPHSKIGELYQSAGAVVFIDNAYGMQTPGKVFEVVLTGRPVLFITDRTESPALEVIKGMEHVITTVNRAEDISGAIIKVMAMKHAGLPAEQVRGFLWDKRSDEYRELITSLDCE